MSTRNTPTHDKERRASTSNNACGGTAARVVSPKHRNARIGLSEAPQLALGYLARLGGADRASGPVAVDRRENFLHFRSHTEILAEIPGVD